MAAAAIWYGGLIKEEVGERAACGGMFDEGFVFVC